MSKLWGVNQAGPRKAPAPLPRVVAVKEQRSYYLAETRQRLGVDWPPRGYWTDEELAEMSRPCIQVRDATH